MKLEEGKSYITDKNRFTGPLVYDPEPQSIQDAKNADGVPQQPWYSEALDWYFTDDGKPVIGDAVVPTFPGTIVREATQ